jgi:hypothetical protein
MINLTSFQDRQYANATRHQAQKRNLLETLRTLNRESVHPLNPNYLKDDATDRQVAAWASFSDLLSASERSTLVGV